MRRLSLFSFFLCITFWSIHSWAHAPYCWLKTYREISPSTFEYAGRIFLDDEALAGMDRQEEAAPNPPSGTTYAIFFDRAKKVGLFYSNRKSRDMDLHSLFHDKISEKDCPYFAWLEGDPEENSEVDINQVPFRAPVLTDSQEEWSADEERQRARANRAIRDDGVVPGPPVSFYRVLWGHFPEMYKEGTIPYLRRVWNEFGNDGTPVKVSFGQKTLYIISDPYDIQEVLMEKERSFVKGFTVKDFRKLLADQAIGFLEVGEKWSALRKSMFPHFAYSMPNKDTPVRGVQDFFVNMVKRSKTFVEYLGEKGNVDFEREMAVFTMQTVAANMLGMEIPGDRLLEIHDAFKIILEFVNYRMTHDPFVNPFTWLPTAYNRRYYSALKVIKDTIQEMLRSDEFLEKEGKGEGSVIRTLRFAKRNGKKSDTKENGLSLTGDDICDQIINIFFAGHETTTHTLSMAVYHLAQEPAVREKLLNEIEKNLGSDGFDINGSPEDLRNSLKSLSYLHATVEETLRINPPVPAIARVAVEDVEIGGYSIPKESILLLFMSATHQLKSQWWKPEKYDPERFMPQSLDTHHPCGRRHPGAFSPFGGGKRICMGRFFAYQEVEIFLVELLRSRIPFRVADRSVIKPIAVPTYKLQNGLPMIFGAQASAHSP